MADKKFIRLVYKRLQKLYGVPTRHPPPLNNKQDPLDELIYILLTLLTHEKNAQRAFDALKSRYSCWKTALGASTAEIAETIKIAGLSNQKGAYIQKILQQIYEEIDSNVTLNPIQAWDRDSIEGFLTKLPGIGKKGARCVMMYCWEVDVLPVDSNVFRVSRRLGIISAEVSYNKSMDLLEQIVPNGLKYDIHVNMVIHGRAVCTAPLPHCLDCGLRDICSSFLKGKFIPPSPPPGEARPRY